VITIIPTLFIVLLVGIATPAVGRHPVAVVALDNGPLAQEMVSVLHKLDAFQVTDTDAVTAHSLLSNLRISAIITVPADFDSNITAGKPVTLPYEVNNVNLDLAADLRRSLPEAITIFYQTAAAKGQIVSPIKAQASETNLRTVDVSLVQYMTIPALVMTMITGGMINGALAMIREYEDTTVKELLLAPVRRSVITAGKIAASWMTALLVGGVFVILVFVVGFLRPASLVSWLGLIFSVLLLTLYSSSLGIALGTLLRTSSRAIPVVINSALYLFFLSGGFAVLAFLPWYVQSIAAFVPNTYGVQALTTSAFYNTSEGLLQDLLILLAASLVTLSLGALALQRRLS
jgi:ABC-type multidrug transport system permease subunit